MTAAAEGRDYAALIFLLLFPISAEQSQSVISAAPERLSARDEPDGGHLESRTSAGSRKNKVPIFAGRRQTTGTRAICGIHLSFTTFGWLYKKNPKKQPTHVSVLNLTDFSADPMMHVCMCLHICNILRRFVSLLATQGHFVAPHNFKGQLRHVFKVETCF